MRSLLIAIFLTILLGIYLNWSYGHFYNFIGKQKLTSPFPINQFSFQNDNQSGTAVYVAIGDSLTSGVGSDDYQQTLPYLIAQKLAQKFGFFKLIILSKPGANSADLVKNQLPDILKLNPDYISLLIGINDIHNLKSTETFGKNFKQIMDDLINKTNAQIYLMNIPYLASDSNLYPPYNYLLDFRTKQFNNIISPYCQFKRIKCVDLYTKSKVLSQTVPGFYSTDLFHPSKKGYQAWANLIDVN